MSREMLHQLPYKAGEDGDRCFAKANIVERRKTPIAISPRSARLLSHRDLARHH